MSKIIWSMNFLWSYFFKNEPLISCPFLSSKLDSPVMKTLERHFFHVEWVSLQWDFYGSGTPHEMITFSPTPHFLAWLHFQGLEKMSSSKEDSNTAFFYSDPQINQVSNLDWLWQIFKHRDSSIRIMGYQMASIIGAKYLAYFLLSFSQNERKIY